MSPNESCTPRGVRSAGKLLLASLVLMAAAGTRPAAAQQASITLQNSNAELCHHNNTAWTLSKTVSSPEGGELTDSGSITWTVTATKGQPSSNTLEVNGYVAVTNSGSAPAMIGNIVVNLQRRRLVSGQQRWVSTSANVARAVGGGAATEANIVATASEENPSWNSAWNAPPTYVVSGARGTFKENAGSGKLEFTDADLNTTWAITPQQTIAVGQTVNLLFQAEFNNSVLNIPAGTQVRAEVIVTFGNAGARGGSGASAANIDINGDGVVDNTTTLQPNEQGNNDADETNVRSVPTRITKTVPALERCNDSVTLTDTADDISVDGEGGGSVSLSNFATTIGGGTGVQVINASTTRTVSVDALCTPPFTGTITNTAYLEGESDSVSVRGPQIGIDPITLQPIYQYFNFLCCVGVDLEDSASVDIHCELPPPDDFDEGDYTTYSKGGYHGTGVPGQIFLTNFINVFSPNGLTIGINDSTGPKHHALWQANTTGRSALQTYLTGGGPSAALTADTVNATSTSGGTLAKQTAALTLNIRFNDAALLGGTSNAITPFGDLEFCNLVAGSTINGFTLSAAQAAALNGKKVRDVLADANQALGGNGLPGYVGSFGNLTAVVDALNLSFHEGEPSAFAVAYLCMP